MAQFQFSQHIDAPPTRVFELASSFERAPEHISGITKVEMVTDGPVRTGTRFKETRVMMGREATEEMEVVEFTPNKSYTLAAESCGSEWRSQLTFQPSGGGTDVNLDMQCKAKTFFAKLMMPIGLLMMGSMKKCIQQDLIDLKAAAEKNDK